MPPSSPHPLILSPPRFLVPSLKDPRWAFAALLALYAFLGCTVLGFNRSPEQILFTVLATCALDLLFHRLLRPGPLPLPLSAVITGLSLSLLLNYAHGSFLILVPIYLAVGSKYVFTHRGKHVFNPSLFGLAATLLTMGELVSPAPAYQWGGTLAASVFLAMAALCLFVFRIRRGPLILSFLVFYTLQTALRAWIMRWHLPPETLFVGTLTSAPFFLFTFYMLTDPRTSPERPRDQVLVALAIAFVDLLLHKLESLYTFYYAAFLVASIRFLALHVRDTVSKSGHPVIPAPGHPVTPRALAVVGLTGFLGWGFWGLLFRPTGPPPGVNFRLEAVSEARSGLSGRLGTTLEETDPRLRHIAKWLLSVGDAVAVGDYDNDGLPDLFLTQPLKRPEDRAVLYRNRGDFHFQRVEIPCLAPIVRDPAAHGLVSGALFVDYDNDGDQDLFLMTGFGACRLLRSALAETGRPTFEDVTEFAGVGEHAVCVAAQFVDLDHDGRLDLFLANALNPYLAEYPGPTPLNPFHLPQPQYPGDRRMFHFMHESWYNAVNGGRNRLFLGTSSGRFQAQDPVKWGMPETHWSLAVGTGDLNADGWTDLYVANDFGPDDLYLNARGTRLQRIIGPFTGTIGRDTYKGMNASVGDLDNDGRAEIYVSNVHVPLQAEGSLLWTVHPRPGAFVPEFKDEAAFRGLLNERRFGWGAAMGDLNRDGWLDLLQANGMVDDTPDHRYPGCPSYWYVNEKLMRAGPEIHGYADRWGDLRGRCIFPRDANRVYLNRGPGARPQFLDVATAAGWTERQPSRGIALADLDNDGDLDAVVTHPFAPPSLYRNVPRDSRQPAPAWIGLRVEGDGVRCAREAIGATVRLTYQEGGRVVTQYREVRLANGFSAQGDRRLHFGLGAHTGPVTARIRWLDGPESEYRDLAANQYHTLRIR